MPHDGADRGKGRQAEHPAHTRLPATGNVLLFALAAPVSG